MTVKIDEKKCLGCGLCVNICPSVFVLIGDKVVPEDTEVAAGKQLFCKSAADNCPVSAITCN
jgi:ferredoxin